jgi:hypothetical protein
MTAEVQQKEAGEAELAGILDDYISATPKNDISLGSCLGYCANELEMRFGIECIKRNHMLLSNSTYILERLSRKNPMILGYGPSYNEYSRKRECLEGLVSGAAEAVGAKTENRIIFEERFAGLIGAYVHKQADENDRQRMYDYLYKTLAGQFRVLGDTKTSYEEICKKESSRLQKVS